GGGRRGHDGARRNGVGQAVSVGVAHEALGPDERGQRLRSASVSMERPANGEGEKSWRRRGGDEDESPQHVAGMLRRHMRTKQKGIALLRCPSASLVWLPQHFTAPCRNQTSDSCPSQGQAACPAEFFEKRANRWNRREGARTSLVQPLQICPTCSAAFRFQPMWATGRSVD